MANGRRESAARARIVRAARRLFARRGYDGVSVADLAGAARVNRALLYYYFKNKRDIYRAAIISVLGLIPPLWERRGAGDGSPSGRLDAYVGAFWAALAKNRDAITLVMREIAFGGQERELIFKRYLIPNARYLAAVLREGMEKGEFAASPPLATAVALLSGMVMPNMGLAFNKRLFAEVGRLGFNEDKYAAFYRRYIRRALGAADEGSDE